MDLNNLKQDIRYSLGDSDKEKFDDQRILLAIRKVVNKLNYKYHLNKKTSFQLVENYKQEYTMPEDYYFLKEARYNGKEIKLLDATSVLDTVETDNSITALVYNEDKHNVHYIYPVPTNLSTNYKIIDSLANQTTIDIDTVSDIKYKDDIIYLLYNVSYTDYTTNLTATLDNNASGILELKYIAEYDLNFSSSSVDVPFSLYDAIHFKVVSDLLSDEDRTELITKSMKFDAKYEAEIQDKLKDDIQDYVDTELLTDYRTAVSTRKGINENYYDNRYN